MAVNITDTDTTTLSQQEENAAPSHPLMEEPISSAFEATQGNGGSMSGLDVAQQESLETQDVPDRVSASDFIPIRARVSEDVDEEYEGDVEEEEGSFASTGSYDSASERLAASSNLDPISPLGLSPEPLKSASSTQREALRRLNELNSGFPSLDTSLLNDADDEGFKARLMKTAELNGLAPDDDVVHTMLSALLPLVAQMQQQSSSVGDEAFSNIGNYIRAMPVAKPTVEDDDENAHMDDAEGVTSVCDTNEEISESEHSEGEILEGSAQGLRVRGDDEEVKEQEDPSAVDAHAGNEGISSEKGVEMGSNGGTIEESQVNADSMGIKQDVGYEDEDVVSLHPATTQSNTTESEGGGAPSRDKKSAGENQVARSDIRFEPLSDVHRGQTEGERSGDNVEQLCDGSNATHPEDSLEEVCVDSRPRGLDLLAMASPELGSENALMEETMDVQTDGEIDSAGSDPGVTDKSDMIVARENEHIKGEAEEKVVEAEKSTGDNEEAVGKLLGEDSSAVAALVSSKSSADAPSDSPSLGGAGPSPAMRPVGLGRSVLPLDHAPRAIQQRTSAVSAPSSSMEGEDSSRANGDLVEGSDDARSKLQSIRIKFLRLAYRLGQSPQNAVVAQVLYRLGLAEQLRGGGGGNRSGAFSFERASVLAEEREAAGQDDLDFACTIMVLGKSGVGKSATINSLFDEVKSGTNAYTQATKKVQEVVGTVHGIRLRVIDTPGLLPSFADQRHNRRVMASVKRFIKRSPPDIVLYVDRLDMQSRDYGDLLLLQTITDAFGAAVWFNAIVVFTHASSAPPDGANGAPVNYEMFVAQRSHTVQQTIRQAAGDMRLMNPVSLVENHTACRRNRAGQRVLPNGQVWKPQLLLLCFASTILAEANSFLKLQDTSPVKPFGVRSRGPPLPYLLSSLLQSRAPLSLPEEQMNDGGEDLDDESDEEQADSDGEEDYDDLPPFRRLTKDELSLLDQDQRRIYYEELDYREKLFMKKQLKDARARRKEMRSRKATQVPEYGQDHLEEENASAQVPVAMPDMVLPPSFDSDNPTFRYRFLDTANQWLIRPVLEAHGWDHDSGYDGVNVEKMLVVSHKIPASVSGQITKDKKEANVQMECAASFWNGDGKVTHAGVDVQTIGKDMAYTVRSETRFSNFKRNKTSCGLAVTKLGDTLAAGMKVEDRLMVGKTVKLVVNGGALTARSDVAYGGSLEASARGKDYPVDQTSCTLGLSVMNWHGDLAIGGNLQSQLQLGKTLFTGRANLNNRGAGQISIRASSSEQVQMALIGLITLVRALVINKMHKTERSQ